MRDIPVGNGTLLVTFDDKYQVRDIYFPHVGQENHTQGQPCRFGVWVDGDFSWVSDEGWDRSLKYLPETLVTDVALVNEKLAIEIHCNDTVASHDNVFLRRVRVINNAEKERSVRIFLHHDLRIYENNFGDTAYYDPETHSLIHYKKHRYFLINTEPHFNSFATGRKAFQGREGTWRDAEDGELQGGAMMEGSVDSTIGVHLSLPPEGIQVLYENNTLLRQQFSAAEREALLRQAETQIRSLTDSLDILKTARTNADIFLRKLLQQGGYKNVTVTFNK